MKILFTDFHKTVFVQIEESCSASDTGSLSDLGHYNLLPSVAFTSL